MTAKLETAFKRVSALPPEEQDMIADQLLAELEDERRWDEAFANSQDVLEKLAAEALEDHRQGKTIANGIDEL